MSILDFSSSAASGCRIHYGAEAAMAESDAEAGASAGREPGAGAVGDDGPEGARRKRQRERLFGGGVRVPVGDCAAGVVAVALHPRTDELLVGSAAGRVHLYAYDPQGLAREEN